MYLGSPASKTSVLWRKAHPMIAERAYAMGSVHFSNDAEVALERDVTQRPDVYVHPGIFRSVSDRPREPETWERYWQRLKRLKSHVVRRKSPPKET